MIVNRTYLDFPTKFVEYRKPLVMPKTYARSVPLSTLPERSLVGKYSPGNDNLYNRWWSHIRYPKSQFCITQSLTNKLLQKLVVNCFALVNKYCSNNVTTITKEPTIHVRQYGTFLILVAKNSVLITKARPIVFNNFFVVMTLKVTRGAWNSTAYVSLPVIRLRHLLRAFCSMWRC